MSLFNIACPECKTTLKSSKPIPAGKVITCPKCSVMFPAPAAKPKPKPVAVGVDVVEEDDGFDDVEIIDDKPKKKPEAVKPVPKAPGGDRPRRKGKRKKSPIGLIIGLTAGLVGFAAFIAAAFFGVKWLLSENNDPIAYLPPKPMLMISIDVERLSETSLGPVLEPLVGAGEFSKYCQEMNSTTKAQLSKWALGIGSPRPNVPGAVSVVYRCKSPIDRQKFSKAFSASPQTFGGRSVYQTGSGLAARTLVFSSVVGAVIGGPPGEAEDVVRTAGRNAPPTIFAEMVKRVSDGHAWIVTDGTMTSEGGSVYQSSPQGIRDSIAHSRCMGIEMSLVGDTIESKTYLLMDGAPAAAKFVEDAKKIGDSSGIAITGFKPSSPSTASASDALATLTESYKAADLINAIGAMSRLASLMTGPPQPPGGGRGGR